MNCEQKEDKGNVKRNDGTHTRAIPAIRIARFMRVRSFRAVLTDVEREFPYRVSLVEALEPVKADGDYVVAVIEEPEMSDDQFFARLSLALQVPGSGKPVKVDLIIFPLLYFTLLSFSFAARL